MTQGPHRGVPTPQPQRQEQFKTRKPRFVNSEERRLLKRQQDHRPVRLSNRIHVYAGALAERQARGRMPSLQPAFQPWLAVPALRLCYAERPHP